MRGGPRFVVIILALLVTAPSQAQTGPDHYLGRTITAVQVLVDGEPVTERAVLDLVETRLGQTLTMARVRDTIDHFIGTARFDDARVFAADGADGSDGNAVSLRWTLRPVRRIARIDLASDTSVSEGAIRTLLADRFGVLPSATRVDELVEAVRGYYAERGFRAPAIVPRLVPADSPERVHLVLQVTSGARTTIADATVMGHPPGSADEWLDRLQLRGGQPYDGPELRRRVEQREAALRADGFYEATVRETTRFADDGSTVAVTIVIEPGAHVRLVFAGDPIDKGELDTLVPVRSERSVDEDLLEDGSRNVERYLRERGYRAAQAPYRRDEQGSELVITFTITRGPLHHVATVAVAGNVALPTAELQTLLKLTPGAPFVDAQAALVESALVELYRVRGFGLATVTSAIAVLPAEMRGNTTFRPVDVRFDIVEGPQTTVSDVSLSGVAAMAETRLREVLTLVAGRPFYQPQLAADRDAIERLYRNAGYQSATVAAQPLFGDNNTQVAITWRVQEGTQTLVDHILVAGTNRIRPEVIRRELTLKPGEPLAADALAESQRRVSALGMFRRVRITELPRSSGSGRDLLVEVEESPPTTLTYGGGLEVFQRARQDDNGVAQDRLEVAPRAFIDLSRRNLWGKNRSVSVFSRVTVRRSNSSADGGAATVDDSYGLNEYRLTGLFREPRAFGTLGDAQFTAFLEQAVRTSFSFNRRGVRADYARRFGAMFNLSGRYTFDRTRLFDLNILPEDQLLIDRLFPQVRLSTFSTAALRDSRDDVLEPNRGLVLGVDGSMAARAYGSEVGFAKTFMQSFAYRRLPGPGFVVAAGARVGLALGFPRDVPAIDADGVPVFDASGQPVVDVVKDLPASERFFTGGDTTVRGFAIDRLGSADTVDGSGFPQGGNGLLLLNAELRAPYWKGLGLVGFVDAGNVFKRAGDIDVADLRVGTGFGVRYRSPIGPLRVDLGFKVNPRLLPSGSRERGAVLHISLGQAF